MSDAAEAAAAAAASAAAAGAGNGDNPVDSSQDGNNPDMGIMNDAKAPDPDPSLSQPGPGNPAGKDGDDQNGDENSQNNQENDGPYHPEGLEDAMRGDTDRDTIDKLNKRVSGLRAKLGAGGEKVPETPEGYQFSAPEGSDMDLSSPVNAPMLAATAAAAHKVGMPQGMAQEFVGEMVAMMPDIVANTPAPEMDVEAEWGKLGGKEKAMPMVTGVKGWIEGLGRNGELSPGEVQEAMIMAGTAEGLLVMNKLRTMTGAKPIPRQVSDDTGLLDRDALRAKRADPRYAKDEAYRRQVDAEFDKFFGE